MTLLPTEAYVILIQGTYYSVPTLFYQLCMMWTRDLDKKLIEIVPLYLAYCANVIICVLNSPNKPYDTNLEYLGL